MRPTFVDIDLGAVSQNVATIADLITPAQFCVVVKADGYGHGDVPVAETALRAGASWVAVALVEEGIRLREAGIGAPILVLSEVSPESALDIVKWELTPSVYTEAFVAALAGTGVKTGVHLKIDTGMHRVGVPPRELSSLLSFIRSHPSLDLEAVWTHFPVADEDPEYTIRQVGLFADLTAGMDVGMVHLANTAGAILHPEARADMCRIGLGTYGLHPSAATRQHVELLPAMRMVSRVTHLQQLEAGERPSYGRVRPLPRDATVATVPVGYADGFPRGRTGDVLIGGVRLPLAGRVTMDQILVDVGDQDVRIGDEVVFLGTQGNEEITADEWAVDLRTISWEIICTVGPRVPRRYQS